MNKPIINSSLISLNLSCNSRNEIIESIAKTAFENGYLSSFDVFLEAVKKREAEFSTAVGYGVAMPHGKSDAVLHPFIAFARLNEPFSWDEEEKVNLIFLIGVPKEEGVLHLKFISQLSKKLLDDDYRQTLATLSDTSEIIHYLNQIEI